MCSRSVQSLRRWNGQASAQVKKDIVGGSGKCRDNTRKERNDETR